MINKEIQLKADFYIIKSCFNYSDEFDVYGIALMTKEEFAFWLDAAKTYFKEIDEVCEMGFGTNEELSFDSYEDVLYGIDYTGLTEQKYKMFYGVLGKYFGKFPDSDLWAQDLKDEVWEQLQSRHKSLFLGEE